MKALCTLFIVLFTFLLPVTAFAQVSTVTDISDPVVTEGNAGTTNVRFTVTVTWRLMPP